MVNKNAYQRETLSEWPVRLPLSVLRFFLEKNFFGGG